MTEIVPHPTKAWSTGRARQRAADADRELPEVQEEIDSLVHLRDRVRALMAEFALHRDAIDHSTFMASVSGLHDLHGDLLGRLEDRKERAALLREAKEAVER